MLKINNEDFKITKVDEGKVHFKIKCFEYFIISDYSAGIYSWRLFEKNNKEGYGRNRIALLKKVNLDYKSIGKKFIYREGQTNKQYTREILLLLSHLGFAETVFTPYIKEQSDIIAQYERKENILADKIRELREKRDLDIAKISFIMNRIYRDIF